jgi:acyl-CoA thioesterase
MTADDVARGRTAPASHAQEVAEAAARAMLSKDEASRSLGMRLEEVRPGFARLRMPIRADMLNGHGTCHGGIVFSLADSAFAVACNTHDAVTVAAAASIDFLASARAGDELVAQAREIWRSRRSGIYEVVVSNQRGEPIALFRGRSHCLGGPVIIAPRGQ